MIDSLPLRGRRAVITGAGGGLGRATAMLFAEAGADLLITDVEADSLAETARRLAQACPTTRCLDLTADLQSVASCREVIAQAEQRLGPIYVLANIAGILRRKPFDQVDEADYDLHMVVNFKAAFFLAQAAARPMVQRGEGRIINVTSTAARIGSGSGSAIYTTAKAAMIAATKCMAYELTSLGVLANCLAPGYMDTPMIRPGLKPGALEAGVAKVPIGRMADPREIAQGLLWLANPATTYVAGETLHVDGGEVMY